LNIFLLYHFLGHITTTKQRHKSQLLVTERNLPNQNPSSFQSLKIEIPVYFFRKTSPLVLSKILCIYSIWLHYENSEITMQKPWHPTTPGIIEAGIFDLLREHYRLSEEGAVL
tara:strand:- start:1281 stop:1619 length:339 start_codon:yes stop_codon:yes gene_type:complete